ncbi:MAG: transcription elongation factor GreAB [Gimesia sp.]|nr:transcription elongation factor GreAB [Gimesia sp.]
MCKMSNPNKYRAVTISEYDYSRLQELLLVANQFASPPPSYIRHLETELLRAKIVPPDQIPPYLVTMNTQVKMTDCKTGKQRVYTLVFPQDADLEEGKLSILSDLGVAILGYSVGDTIEWEFPEGTKQIQLDMICFQPEATKHYEL